MLQLHAYVCAYLSFSRSRFPSLSLSWPLYLAFSFRIVISRGSEQRAERAPALGTVCQLVERDSNSIGWPGTVVRDRAGPFRFFAPVPSFAFPIALPRPAKHADCFFVLLHQTSIPPRAARYTPPPIFSIRFRTLPFSGPSHRSPFSLSRFTIDNRSTRNCEVRAT